MRLMGDVHWLGSVLQCFDTVGWVAGRSSGLYVEKPVQLVQNCRGRKPWGYQLTRIQLVLVVHFVCLLAGFLIKPWLKVICLSIRCHGGLQSDLEIFHAPVCYCYMCASSL